MASRGSSKPGETIVASIEGIGTPTLPVVAGPAPPQGTGAYLPPVSTYRRNFRLKPEATRC